MTNFESFNEYVFLFFIFLQDFKCLVSIVQYV